jgi:cobalamin synthase
MPNRRPIKVKVYTRAITAIALITAWVLSAFSGLVLWLAPEVRQAGKQPLLFNITKQEWGEIHFWICVAVVAVTIIHIILDWRALRGVIRYMTSVHRNRITRIE